MNSGNGEADVGEGMLHKTLVHPVVNQYPAPSEKETSTPLPTMSAFNATTSTLYNNECAIIQLLLRQPTFHPDRIEACRMWCCQVRAQLVSPYPRMVLRDMTDGDFNCAVRAWTNQDCLRDVMAGPLEPPLHHKHGVSVCRVSAC